MDKTKTVEKKKFTDTLHFFFSIPIIVSDLLFVFHRPGLHKSEGTKQTEMILLFVVNKQNRKTKILPYLFYWTLNVPQGTSSAACG